MLQPRLDRVALAATLAAFASDVLALGAAGLALGQRAHGFAAASEAYFGKPLKDITVAEAAMLAGLPKAQDRADLIAFLKVNAQK